MKIPLYENHQAPEKKPDKDSHAGLWFERFFNQYAEDWAINEVKTDWINTVKKEQGNAEKLAQFQNRQQNLITALKGQSHRYKTDWNFVSGMGNPHPVENGFSWHPTLAVPYIAGSAVKGLVRAWVELDEEGLFDNNQQGLDDRLKAWFGTASKKDEVAEQSGSFIFFDAIPDKPPTLVCDIMTPHMKDWYQNDKGSTKPNDVPADWHEPTPIPFLAVKKQAQFVFNIAPRTKQVEKDIPQVFEALENALLWLGAGAKTAAGYGYMTIDPKFETEKQAKQEQQQKQAEAVAAEQKLINDNKNRTPLAQEYFIAAGKQEWDSNKAAFIHKEGLAVWLDKLDQLDKPEAEILEDLVRLIKKHYKPGLLEVAKTGGAKEKKFKPNQIEMAKTVLKLQAK